MNRQTGDAPDVVDDEFSRSLGPSGRAALDQLFGAAYEELRRLALAVRRRDSSATMTPTVLVNEAWLKLAGTPGLVFESPLHFRRIAARAMRRLLVDAARRRTSLKRGGTARDRFVTFDEVAHDAAMTESELIALDDALDELEQLEPRQALAIEYRFFGGMEMNEIATALGISEATVHRDWRSARAWLNKTLRIGP